MRKKLRGGNYIRRLRLVYCFASFMAFLGGAAIYVFFRNSNNMTLFRFFPKPSVLGSLYTPLHTVSIWNYVFVFNLPYGFWCLSGLLFIRAVWLADTKWGNIYGIVYIAIVMSYIFLKLPGIIPGTFDILDLAFMGTFAFLERIVFNMFNRRKIE